MSGSDRDDDLALRVALAEVREGSHGVLEPIAAVDHRLDLRCASGCAAIARQPFLTGEYPDFVEHVRQHLEPHEGDEGGFELGLDLILDGLERLRDAA